MPHHAPQAIVNLSAIAENYARLRRQSARAKIGGVVKANAYGLGAHRVAQTLATAGCITFFVANLDEALSLRTTLPTQRIVVLHGVPSTNMLDAAAHNLTPVLNSPEALSAWSTQAQNLNRRLPAFIHLDTGMNRLGFTSKDTAWLRRNLDLLKPLELSAWMTHFTRADEFDHPMTTAQRDVFYDTIQTLPVAPISLSNSSGLFWDASYHGDLARPGLALYGGNPTPAQPNPMAPVLELQAPLLQIHEAAAGEPIGYAGTRKLTRNSRLGTLALGYADGYPRTLSDKGSVLINGHPAPVLGRISMDLTVVDVTDMPLPELGTMATVIGPHRPLDQAAQEAGTIAYEILTSLGPRVTRLYL